MNVRKPNFAKSNMISRQGRSKQPVLGTLGYNQQTALFEEDPGGQHDDDALGGGSMMMMMIHVFSMTMMNEVVSMMFKRLCFLSAKKPLNECLDENFTHLSPNIEIQKLQN